MKSLKNVAGFGRRMLRSSLALLSVVGAIGRAGHCAIGRAGRRWDCSAWATWPEGASAPNGTMKCRGHGVPEMVTPTMRTLGFLNLTIVLLGFFNLTNMPCSVLP